MVRISGFHPEGPGSTPGDGIVFFTTNIFLLTTEMLDNRVSCTHIYLFYNNTRVHSAREKFYNRPTGQTVYTFCTTIIYVNVALSSDTARWCKVLEWMRYFDIIGVMMLTHQNVRTRLNPILWHESWPRFEEYRPFCLTPPSWPPACWPGPWRLCMSPSVPLPPGSAKSSSSGTDIE